MALDQRQTATFELAATAAPLCTLHCSQTAATSPYIAANLLASWARYNHLTVQATDSQPLPHVVYHKVGASFIGCLCPNTNPPLLLPFLLHPDYV